jgi:hypothetical protein
MFTIDVEPANFIYIDLFPATTHEEYRVIVTDNRLYILDDTIDGPKAIISEPLVEFIGSNKTGYLVYTEYRSFQIERAQNCGCGSRLRQPRPFDGVPFIARLERK